MTSAEITDLIHKAAAATEGPWQQASQRGSDSKLIEQPDEHGAFIADTYEEEDAEYIAAASPDRILWLVAELERLKADYEALRLAGNYFGSYVAGPLPGIESSPDNLFPKRANGTR